MAARGARSRPEARPGRPQLARRRRDPARRRRRGRARRGRSSCSPARLEQEPDAHLGAATTPTASATHADKHHAATQRRSRRSTCCRRTVAARSRPGSPRWSSRAPTRDHIVASSVHRRTPSTTPTPCGCTTPPSTAKLLGFVNPGVGRTGAADRRARCPPTRPLTRSCWSRSRRRRSPRPRVRSSSGQPQS